MTVQTVSGFAVETDLAYDLDRHMWVSSQDAGVVRIGMDSLGLETSGTLAQLSFQPHGEIARGEPFGSLEAEKFVGPLVSPLSGRILAVNESAMTDPGLVEREIGVDMNKGEIWRRESLDHLIESGREPGDPRDPGEIEDVLAVAELRRLIEDARVLRLQQVQPGSLRAGALEHFWELADGRPVRDLAEDLDVDHSALNRAYKDECRRVARLAGISGGK